MQSIKLYTSYLGVHLGSPINFQVKYILSFFFMCSVLMVQHFNPYLKTYISKLSPKTTHFKSFTSFLNFTSKISPLPHPPLKKNPLKS